MTSPFGFIQPCSPVPAKAVPAGDDWVHEVKFDGYRVQAHKVGSRVVMYSRNGHDFTDRFPSIAQLLRELPAKTAALDCEVVASDVDGRPNFARLHVRWTQRESRQLCVTNCPEQVQQRSCTLFDLLVGTGNQSGWDDRSHGSTPGAK